MTTIKYQPTEKGTNIVLKNSKIERNMFDDFEFPDGLEAILVNPGHSVTLVTEYNKTDILNKAQQHLKGMIDGRTVIDVTISQEFQHATSIAKVDIMHPIIKTGDDPTYYMSPDYPFLEAELHKGCLTLIVPSTDESTLAQVKAVACNIKEIAENKEIMDKKNGELRKFVEELNEL